MISGGDFPVPEMSENIKQFKNNEIPQTDYGPSNTFHFGNSKDTLKVMSQGLHSGESIDQHIQATIDGQDHILANVDDAVAKNVMAAFNTRYVDEHTGAEKIEPGKIVGAVNTKASDTDVATVIIGKAKVIIVYEGQVLPEDKEKPSRVNEEIHIGSEDGTVGIKSTDNGKIDFSIGSLKSDLGDLTTKTVENLKFEDSSLVTKAGGDTSTLSLTSTKSNLSFDTLSDGILDINMDNFYNTESVLKDDIVNLYNNVYPTTSLRKVSNVFDIQAFADAASARTDPLAKNLEERLPVAPKEAGRYLLAANIRNNINGETTTTYTWDGTDSLPAVYVPTDINEVQGSILWKSLFSSSSYTFRWRRL